MAKRLFVERRAQSREEAPVEQTAEEKKHDEQRHQKIHDEVAALEESTDEVLEHIDAVLAGVGNVAIQAA